MLARPTLLLTAHPPVPSPPDCAENNWQAFQWLMFADPSMLLEAQQAQQRQQADQSQQQRYPVLPLAPALPPQEQQGGQAAAEQRGSGVAEQAAVPAADAAAGVAPVVPEEAAAREAVAALLSEAVAAVEAAESREGEQQAVALPATQPHLPLLPPTEVQFPEAAAAGEPAHAAGLPLVQQPQQPQQGAPLPPAAAQQQQQQGAPPPLPAQQQQQQAQLPPWLLAVKLTAKSGQLDWLSPEDAGGIFTIKSAACFCSFCCCCFAVYVLRLLWLLFLPPLGCCWRLAAGAEWCMPVRATSLRHGSEQGPAPVPAHLPRSPPPLPQGRAARQG